MKIKRIGLAQTLCRPSVVPAQNFFSVRRKQNAKNGNFGHNKKLFYIHFFGKTTAFI